ncbi:tape measure protein [Klebsiella variicola]|uniref:tape measure protein n=1 Tax=Klebsiella variicola TaxID=244366 RepID=UPI00155F9940|nr:tape measure protein [Klebsiella variicola]NRE95117.1 tape measure protein [Klebsiella variicola]HDY9206471.1 tape measure protein [Klebsiella pneumoniae]
MSDIVDFKLTLNDKEFSTSIKNAGNLLETFGKTASNNSKKMSSLERSVVATGRSFSVLSVSLGKGADKMEDFAAGAELASQNLRSIRENIAAINRSLSVFSTRVDQASGKVGALTSVLKKAQSELLDFADFADYARKSAKNFSNDASAMGNTTSSLNRRLSNTSKVLDRWKGTTDKAADGLKNVRDQMDAVIDRQKTLSGKILGGGRVGGSGGGSGGAGSNRDSARGHSERGLFEGLRGNIFLLGEIGDAARTVKDILFGWQEPLIQAMSKMQNTRILLQGLEKDAKNPQDAAEKDMNFIMGLSEKVHVSLDAVSDAFVKLKSGGIDPTTGSLNALVNSVAQFGGDSEILKRAAIAIQQMSGKGVISMEELRQQLGEAVPTAMQSMADTMGVSMAKLVKDVSLGTVEAKSALDMLFLGMEIDSAGAADRLSHSFTGALAQMQTAFMRFADNMAKGGYLDALSDGLKQLSTYLNTTEGQLFAYNFGQGMTAIVKTLTEMASWIGKNIELVKTIAQIVGLGMGFKLLKTIVTGSLGTALEMFSSLNKSLGLATKGVTGFLSVTGKIVQDIRNFGLFAAAVINVTEAIRGAKTAWLAFTAVLQFNPIIIGITAVVGVVALLASTFESVSEKASDALEKIKAVPEAMGKNEQAALNARLKQLDLDEKELEHQRTLYLEASPAGRKSMEKRRSWAENGLEGIDTRLKEIRGQRLDIQNAMGGAVVAVASKEISRNLQADLKKVDDQFTKDAASLSKSAKDYRDRSDAISNDKSLSKDEKSSQLEKLNADRQKKLVDATQKRLDGYQNLVKTLQDQKANVESQLKSESLTAEQKKALDTKNIALSKQINDLNSNQVQMAQADLERAKKSMSSDTPKLGNQTKLDDTLALINQYAGKKIGDYTNVNTGAALRDLANNVITGPNQMAVNQRLVSALGSGKVEDLSKSQLDSIKDSLAKAVKADKEAADKRLQSANIAAGKQQSIDAMVAKANQQVVSSANELAGQLGLTSKASASFDESVKKTLAQIDNALKDQDINGKALPPSARFTDEQKRQMIRDREFIQANATDYSQRLDRDSANQTVSKFTTTTSEIMSSVDRANRQATMAKWREDYQRDIKTLQGYIATTQSDVMKSVYQRSLKAMQDGGKRAFIENFGTETQKLGLEYEDVAGQIETAWSDAFANMTDTITDFIMDGKASFSDFARSIIKDIASIIVKSQITAPLMNMMGMGTNGAGNTGNIAGAMLNQGVSLVSSGGAGVNVNNGDKSIGQSAKETSAGISQMSTATENANSGLSGMVSSAWNSTKSFLGLGTATGNQTKAIGANILTMNNLSSVAAGLTAVFASMGASSNSSKGRWMNFGLSMVSAATSVWAGSMAGGAGKSTGGAVNATKSNGFSNANIPSNGQNIPPIPKFEKGGIMGPNGVIPLKTYSKGGIATSPQLALFGEGRDNEAYVPLPDGRSIPVTMTGSVGGGGTIAPVAININVNSDGSGSTSGSGTDSKGWNDAAQRIKNIVLETITEEKRPGGSLNKNTNGNR